MKNDIAEKQTAVGIDALIAADIKNVEDYENALVTLKLKVMSSKKSEELDKIEEHFILLKEKIKLLIDKYKMPANEFDKITQVIDYKVEKEMEYLMAHITHQAYNIPTILEKIIVLEDQLESMDSFLLEHKYIKRYPSQKWEMFENKKYNVKQECLKFSENLEKQTKYIDTIKHKLDAKNFTESVKEHIYALNSLSKKINHLALGYQKGELVQENLLPLMITMANANNILRGFKEVLNLDNNQKYINHISFEEEIYKHLDDFRLLKAINSNSLNLTLGAIDEYEKAFSFIKKDNPLFDNTYENLLGTCDIFKKKAEKIDNL